MAATQRSEIVKLLKQIFRRNKYFVFIDQEIYENNIIYNELNNTQDLISNLYKIVSILKKNYLYVSKELQEESDLLNLLITQNTNIDEYLNLTNNSDIVFDYVKKYKGNSYLDEMLDRHIQRLTKEDGKSVDEIKKELKSYTFSCFI